MAAPDGPSAQQTMLLVLLGFFDVDFWGGRELRYLQLPACYNLFCEVGQTIAGPFGS